MATRSKLSRSPASDRSPAPSRKARKSEAADPSLQVAQQIWPVERDVLFRPDRMKYVRKLLKPEGCVFCAAASEKPSFETLCVHQTEHSMVVLNKFPYNSGHLLVLPRRHCGDLLQLSEAEYLDYSSLIRKALVALQEIYLPGGVNLGMNHGAAAGAGIPDHLHQHLIPRWAGDLNFFPLIADTKVVVETLDQTWDRLRRHFKASKSAALPKASAKKSSGRKK